ncbi:hypothetical protein EB840_26115 [Klebsiella quasipneumoniae]|nr:hypothetical protein EB840_26115 [Klebsiella quasipneumoniae]
MGSCAAPSAKGDDKFITTDYLQQCLMTCSKHSNSFSHVQRTFLVKEPADGTHWPDSGCSPVDIVRPDP